MSFEIRHGLDLSSGFAHPPWYTFVVHLRRNILTGTVLASLLAILSGESWGALATDHAVFSTFTRHITRQVSIDKQAFAQASTCLSWFYKATKRPPPPAVQGISWRRTLSSSQPDEDCPRQYPGGMDAAREDFAKTQTLLSVSLTVYEFALVADHNDDQSYSTAELQDLFHSLSLAYDAGDPPSTTGATLTARFDKWYLARSLDEVMQGMSTLYDRGYRVTEHDRTELDRVMR